MALFGRKPSRCTICNIELRHKNKPKREWGIKGPLCGDCYVTKSKEFFEAKVVQPCAICGTKYRIADMWEPRWQWNMDGLLCKKCFDAKESSHDAEKATCALCGGPLKFIRYNPKPKWQMNGQLCRTCWDQKKADMG